MRSDDFEFVTKQRLEFLLQTERERQPPHVARLSALPEVHDASEIVLHSLVVAVVIFVLALRAFDGDPVSTEENVAVLSVELTCKFYF